MSANEDQADVARVLAGDTDSFEGVVQRWHRPLVNLAFRFCRDQGRAEEMAQEAFLRAFRALRLWRRDSAFSTWLFAIALNVIRTETRRIPAQVTSLDEISEMAHSNASDASESATARNEIVRRAVLNLPEKYRDALILFYFHDTNVHIAAQTLGVAEGTVKARLFRAREMLRTRLERSFAESFESRRLHDGSGS